MVLGIDVFFYFLANYVMSDMSIFSLVKINENCEIRKVLHVESVYAILLYLIVNKRLDDTLILTSDNFPHELSDRIPNIITYNKIARPNRFDIFLSSLFGFKPKCFKEISVNLNLFSQCTLYGHDHLPLSLIFRKRDMFLIEDGLSNYVVRPGIYNKIKAHLNILPYGYRKKVKKIYLTEIMDLPFLLREKIEVLDIKNGVKDNIEYINKLFPPSWEIIKGADIFITQPLEDMGISEHEKISIYKELITNKSNECRPIYIKPHPRETTDYKDVFSSYDNIYVLDGKIPVEVYVLISEEIESVTTLFSTSAYTIKRICPNTIVKFIGTEWNKTLKDKFGIYKSETF